MRGILLYMNYFTNNNLHHKITLLQNNDVFFASFSKKLFKNKKPLAGDK